MNAGAHTGRQRRRPEASGTNYKSRSPPKNKSTPSHPSQTQERMGHALEKAEKNDVAMVLV